MLRFPYVILTVNPIGSAPARRCDHPQIRPERALRSGPWLWCIASCGVASGVPLPSRLCLPRKAKELPSGPNWIHEIKHDGFRIMARRESTGVRLITRHGNDFTARFPLAAAAVSALSARSFLIDGEAIVTNSDGLAMFDLIRRASG